MISKTLYADYIKERDGFDIIENECGFIVYKLGPNECFIVNMYVVPEARKGSTKSILLNQLYDIAKSCQHVTGSIWLNKPGAMETLKAALRSGFAVQSGSDDCLFILKDLRSSNG